MQYAELHCLSNFSFLRGASHPQELVARAHELGYGALALTDECSLAGIVKAHTMAKECGLQLIVGAEFVLEENIRVIALVADRTGYSELSALITIARRRSAKGEYCLHLRDLEHNLRHNLLIWKPELSTTRTASTDHAFYAAALRRGFGDRLWIGYSNLLRGDEYERYALCAQLARQWQIPLLACGDAAMHAAERKPLLDALTANYHNTSITELGWRRDGNGERYLREPAALQNLYPQALLKETTALARRCAFSMSELRYRYPPEVVPDGMSPADYLAHRVELGARQRWPGRIPDGMQQRIETELALIAELQYEYYFLTVFDIVRFARKKNIFCQGRGSAANSVICYCLGITEVAPEKTQLLFERFISRERKEPPDIDVDFEHERREEVIQYIYDKYGRERAALAATVICYRARSAIRAIGKALGFDPTLVDQLAKALAWWDRREDLLQRFDELGLDTATRTVDIFFELVQQLRGFPRHLSQHVGGFVITAEPISTLVPVENAAMADRTVIQWDKEDLEAMGLMKIDVLALGMLTAIRKCLRLIPHHYTGLHTKFRRRVDAAEDLVMQDIDDGDTATYEMLQRADSVGVFQVESRAQMSMLPRLKPAEYYDLVVQVAIVRPGPIQGNMVHPYLRRRQKLEPTPEINPVIQDVVARTYGVPIFQEQVIKLAMVAADFTGGEVDQLRRAMATWGKNGDLMKFRDKLIGRMTRNGHAQEFAETLFEMMKGFGSYGFPESHAASFALLVYISAWLKCHYPAAFYCALLNSQPMGFYSPSQLVQDARRRGIEVWPVDVMHSEREHTLETGTDAQSPALRLGLCLVKGFGDNAAAALIDARRQRRFIDIGDLQRRARLNQSQLRSLIEADALRALSGHRHQSHWQAQALRAPALAAAVAPIDAADSRDDYNDGIELPAPSEIQDITADYNSTRLTLQRHPLAWLRERSELLRNCKKYDELHALGSHRFVRVAGIVTGRQRPGTETGIIFMTLEDETGNTNVIVRPEVQLRCREALLKATLLVVKGVVESNQGVVHVIAGELLDFSHYLRDMTLSSRDFH